MDRSPLQWALTPLRKYATFSGRASRAEFWWFMLLLIVVYLGGSFLLGGILGVAGASSSSGDPSVGLAALAGGSGLILILFWLAVIIPTIAVQVRRLHDTGRSGWWIGVYYIGYALLMFMMFGSMLAALGGGGDPAAGGLGLSFLLLMAWGIFGIVLLVFFILPGTSGANQYGPDPYGSDYGEVFR